MSLSRTRFPRGTLSPMIDAIARAPLWEHGLDYGHGTGHGVGYFLNVHEGPQTISQALPEPHMAMQPGMITSIEPGVYRPGRWGVRIENLVLARAGGHARGRRLRRDARLRDADAVPDRHPLHRPARCCAPTRCEWLDRYHVQVRERLLPLVERRRARLAAAAHRAAGGGALRPMVAGATCAIGVDVGGTKIEAHPARCRGARALARAHRVAARQLRRVAAGHRGRGGARRAGGRRRTVHHRRRRAGQRDRTRRDEELQLHAAQQPPAATRPRGAARPAGARDQRCQLPGVVGGHRWRRRGRRRGVRRHPRHRRRRRHRGARPSAQRAQRIGRRMGPQPAAVGARRRAAPSLLLRPAKLHRDPRQRPLAGARSRRAPRRQPDEHRRSPNVRRTATAPATTPWRAGRRDWRARWRT